MIYGRLEGLLPDDVFFADAYSVTFPRQPPACAYFDVFSWMVDRADR